MVRRIADQAVLPDEQELNATTVATGDFVIAGFPRKPFTDLGREAKRNSKFKVTFIVCCANGYEGYYPVKSAYDGGYEIVSARFAVGTVE